VPEGHLDFESGHALPFESNLDYLNAVHFEKGCYLGQELTARTHYKGVIRKRLFPLVVEQEEEEEEEEGKGVSIASNEFLFPPFLFKDFKTTISSPGTLLRTKEGAKIGKMHFGIYNVGIGMVRLEHVKPEVQDTIIYTEDNIKLRLIKPHWWETYCQHVKEMERKIVQQFKEESGTNK